MPSLYARIQAVLGRVLLHHELGIKPAEQDAPEVDRCTALVDSGQFGRAHEWWLISEDGRTVGVLEVVIHPGCLWVNRLAVRPSRVGSAVVCDVLTVLQDATAEAGLPVVRALPVTDPCAHVPWDGLGFVHAEAGYLEWRVQRGGETLQDGGGRTLDAFTQPTADSPAEPVEEATEATTWIAEGKAIPGARFVIRKLLGRGAMGEVWAADDLRLGTSVALKVMRAEHTARGRYRVRFQQEIRVTAQLDHPAIVTVLDTGELPNGRVWFAMDRVRGNDLLTVQRTARPAHPRKEPALHDVWVRRVAGYLQVVAQAVASAHARGVVHRDIKPANVMVGRFGEVLLMDWGVARNLNEADAYFDLTQPPIVGSGSESEAVTRVGQRVGTLAYMAPEQARGEAHLVGPPADVFALGVTLFEVLTGLLPVRRGVCIDDRSMAVRLEHARVPVPLRELVEAATHEDAAERPSALDFAAALQRFLDGSVRREKAERAFQDAVSLLPEVTALRQRAQALQISAARALAVAPRFGPAEARVPGWRLEDEADQLHGQALLKEAELERSLASALELWDGHEGARAALVDLYLERAAGAERSGDRSTHAAAVAALRATADPRAAAWLQAKAAVSLVTDPPGAEVLAHRQGPVDRRLATVETRALGPAPLQMCSLPAGSWILELRAPGRITVNYPVYLRRGEHWDGVPPGAAEPIPIILPHDGELGPNDCYVPAGWTKLGGDPQAVDAVDACLAWVDAMVVRRWPVTLSEWFEWVDTRPTVTPQMRLGVLEPGSPLEKGSRRVEGGFEVALTGEHGTVSGRLPAAWMNVAAARAFARWEARRTGESWQLPTEWMWEKAARGVDGRFYPWGDHFDGAWAVTGERKGVLLPVAVDAPTADVGPYGIAHMAGQLRNHCSTLYAKDGGLTDRQRIPEALDVPLDPASWYCARGGSSGSRAAHCRSAGRFASLMPVTYGSVGLRLFRWYTAPPDPH